MYLLSKHWTEVMNFRGLVMMDCTNALQEKIGCHEVHHLISLPISKTLVDVPL